MKLSQNRVRFSPDELTSSKKFPAPQRGHVHYYDVSCSALVMRVTSGEHRSFKAYNRDGVPQFIPIAEVGEMSLDEARQRALDILQSMRVTGMTPKAQAAAQAEERQKEKRLDITLGAALDQYLAARVKPGRKRSIKQATADTMRREVSKYLLDCLDLPLRSLTYSVLDEAHEAIIERYAPSVADRVMCNVGTLIRYVEEKEEVHLFGHNPARKVLKLDGHVLHPRKSHLPAERFPDFFDATTAMNEDAADFLLISLFTVSISVQ